MATLFTKIITGQLKGTIIYQDELCAVLEDIQPKAPKHFLIVPKKEIVSVNQTGTEDQHLLGHLLLVAKKVAQQLGIAETGYRLVINTGKDGGQSVDHLHIHLLAGRKLEWPPG